MTPLKRKVSCTFKRETPLEAQERIYQLTVAISPAEAEHRFRPRTNRGPTCLRQAGKSGPRYTLPPRCWREGSRGHFVRQVDLPKRRLKSLWAAQLWGWPETRAGAGGRSRLADLGRLTTST